MPRTKDNLKREVASLLSKMTVRGKASLLYGRRFWYVTGKETGEPLPEIMVTDGPSGLRKQCGKTDMIGLNESVPSIAYPTGSALASSWDPALLFSVGQALAEDCIKEDVAVILGPAVNHKRDPLCGRNFEYYSEDPVLTADLGTAMVALCLQLAGRRPLLLGQHRRRARPARDLSSPVRSHPPPRAAVDGHDGVQQTQRHPLHGEQPPHDGHRPPRVGV